MLIWQRHNLQGSFQGSFKVSVAFLYQNLVNLRKEFKHLFVFYFIPNVLRSYKKIHYLQMYNIEAAQLRS